MISRWMGEREWEGDGGEGVEGEVLLGIEGWGRGYGRGMLGGGDMGGGDIGGDNMRGGDIGVYPFAFFWSTP